MAGFIDQETAAQIREILGTTTSNIRIILFTRERECPYCPDQRRLLEELTALSSRLKLTVHDLDKDRSIAEQYRIDKVPATVIATDRDYGIRFFGLTAGHEFTSIINALVMVGTGRSALPPELEQIVKTITRPVHLEVMVTLTCPYCPQSVFAAQQLAFVNEHITADAVDATEFPELSKRYDVSGVPKTVINGAHSFVGAQPVQSLLLEVLKAVDPEAYAQHETAIRESKGHRHARKADPKRLYDTVIVGGGPAALTAALYAARKAMDVLLLTRELGGQMTNTETIDNYLGLPGSSGKELYEQFLFHVEQYPIAEGVGEPVAAVTKSKDGFEVRTADDRRFRGRSVIYCAGKEYRTLGVAGEDKYIGRGISFCAICDAPLYRDKRVAVVGGGNSAFTAVRDLARFAKEVFLIHRRDAYRADPVLVDEIKKLKGVRLYPGTTVKGFTGGDKLTGLRLQSGGRSADFELEVDGVFLEVGLAPNTAPVKELIGLNERAEIPVAKDNSTPVPGFYAAGDATDVPGKQIIIACGEGAKAAIAAYNYLINNKLIGKKVPDESWS